MDTMLIDAETTQADDVLTDPAHAVGDVNSLPAMFEPSQALAAARRLYLRNRTGVRFFCENRRVVPVDQLEPIDEPLQPVF